MIVLYFALNALFLQSYLGDAARYFRNSPGNVTVRREIRKEAVDTLDALHASGKYDRIIVVAHSLGTVVAYDMLRAYFSRICNNLPDPAALGPQVDDVDGMIIEPETSSRKSAGFATTRARSSGTSPPSGRPRGGCEYHEVAGHRFRHAGQRADTRPLSDVQRQYLR